MKRKLTINTIKQMVPAEKPYEVNDTEISGVINVVRVLKNPTNV